MLKKLSKNFQVIGVYFFTLLAISFMQPNVAVAGGFSRTCSRPTSDIVGGRFIMRAACRARNGEQRQPELAISDYIANYNGNLAWASLGKFNASCEQIEIDGNELKAKCKDVTGALKDTSINLDEKISNQDGVLAADF
ncbi:CVNH domain-containing protein [Nostoc commune]|uniref:mannose-binding lectin n=1 Tax=Nostoc commune TaxID=1178 RepID=UPI0018C4EC04|nr:CVNH domain-containing protein [Nostoc commune]